MQFYKNQEKLLELNDIIDSIFFNYFIHSSAVKVSQKLDHIIIVCSSQSINRVFCVLVMLIFTLAAANIFQKKKMKTNVRRANALLMKTQIESEFDHLDLRDIVVYGLHEPI